MNDKVLDTVYPIVVLSCFFLLMFVFSYQVKVDNSNMEYLNSVPYAEKTYKFCRIEKQWKENLYSTSCGMFVSYYSLDKGITYNLTTSSHNVIVKRFERS